MVFVDLMEASHVDSTLDTLTDITVNFLREKFPISLSYFVAGPKRGNALLIRAVARRLGCNSAFVKEQPLFFAWIEGLVDPGQPVIVIDDVASDGELLLHAIERLRDAGHRVIGALVLVDRVEGDSAHLLKRNDVEFHYMMSASDDDLRRVRTEQCVAPVRDSRVDHLEAAIGAARAGADAIRTQWRSGGVVEARTKTAVADVSTRLDEAADSAIAEFLNTVLPSPVILSEELSDESLVEKGRSLSSERWLVDPLDGSHNASIGLALVGVAIAWTESDVVRGAVLLDVFGGALLAADSSGRLVVEGDLQVGSPHRGAAVALQQAYLTPRDSAGLAAARDLLEATFPRVLTRGVQSSTCS